MTDDLHKAARSLHEHIGDHLCALVVPVRDYSVLQIGTDDMHPLIAYLNGPWEQFVDHWHGHPVVYRPSPTLLNRDMNYPHEHIIEQDV